MTNNKKLEIAHKVLSQIPAYYNPKIGGSLALYVYGLTDQVNDIDIIVNRIDSDLSLPYKTLELTHKTRLNETIKYEIDEVIVEIHESLMPRDFYGKYEKLENIISARKILKKFFQIFYKENMEKWQTIDNKPVSSNQKPPMCCATCKHIERDMRNIFQCSKDRRLVDFLNPICHNNCYEEDEDWQLKIESYKKMER